MPSEPLFSAFMFGLIVGALLVSIPCRWWTNQSHRRVMDAYDRSMQLLSARYDLFRDVHQAAMNKLAEKDRP
ncbi:hypothetical protein [Ancylobacter oerskovii]|uniref:Minor tail protein n=1 Tax=Ancylobacter oerskovii TaxID=459519 RepID=A0ABW4Z164_9HYPH|nr:hypothetical protein [Ancylobacter oerskovii]MBS7545067.1 hypothetical protein [Ancylobacter oerskovii]